MYSFSRGSVIFLLFLLLIYYYDAFLVELNTIFRPRSSTRGLEALVLHTSLAVFNTGQTFQVCSWDLQVSADLSTVVLQHFLF